MVYNVLYIILKNFLYIGLRSLVVTGKSDSMRPKRLNRIVGAIDHFKCVII